MASPPPPPAAAAAALKDCWGCRLVCGAGLLGAGGYVLAAARQVMKSRAAPPGMGTVAQIVFGVGLASWGVVVLVDPVNNIRDANTPIAGRGQDV